ANPGTSTGNLCPRGSTSAVSTHARLYPAGFTPYSTSRHTTSEISRGLGLSSCTTAGQHTRAMPPASSAPPPPRPPPPRAAPPAPPPPPRPPRLPPRPNGRQNHPGGQAQAQRDPLLQRRRLRPLQQPRQARPPRRHSQAQPLVHLLAPAAAAAPEPDPPP